MDTTGVDSEPQPAAGLRLGLFIGAGTGVVTGIVLPLILLGASLLFEWADQPSSTTLLAFVLWVVIASVVGSIIGAFTGAGVGLVLGASRWEGVAPIAALVLAPVLLLGLVVVLASMDQFGDVKASEWATFALLLIAFAAIGFGAGVLFRNKLRATTKE